MAKGNLISKTIPAAVVASTVDQTKQSITALSPYEVNLSVDEVGNFPEVNEERIPFLVKGMGYTGTDPDYLPKKTDVVELNNDNKLFTDARKMYIQIKQLETMVGNIMRLGGSDVYVTLLQYYRNVQSAADMGDARAKVIYEDLKPAFIKKSKRIP